MLAVWLCPSVAGMESMIFCYLKRLMHVLCILVLCENLNLLTWFYLYMRTHFFVVAVYFDLLACYDDLTEVCDIVKAKHYVCSLTV